MNETIITIKHDGDRTPIFRIEGCCTGRTYGNGIGNVSDQPKPDYTRNASRSKNCELFNVVLSDTEYLVIDKKRREVRLFHREKFGRGKGNNVFVRSMPL